MRLAQDQEVIKAVAPDTAQHALADRMRPWRMDRRSQHLDPTSCCDGSEARPKFRIIVKDEITRAFPKTVSPRAAAERPTHPSGTG